MAKEKISFTSSLLISIGIVIGSGIFFKLEEVYEATGYNYIYSAISWLIIGGLLVISSYAAAQVALRAETTGGLISFTEYCTNKFFASLVGIFQYIIYIPMFISLLAIKSSEYFFQAFGIEYNIYLVYFAALLFLSSIFLIQYNSTKLAAKVSDVTTVVKVIPLFLIFIAGLAFGDFSHLSISYSTQVSQGFDLTYLFAPFIAIALTFDGWISIGSIQKDMQNPRKDLYRVYIFSILIITVIYFLYSVGVGLLLSPEQFSEYSSNYIVEIGRQIVGDAGASILLLFVVASAFGALNGFFLSGTYYTQASAQRKEIVGYDKLVKYNEKTKTYSNSIIFTYITGLIMLLIYFFQDLLRATDHNSLFTELAIDDLTVFLGAVFFVIFFMGVVINFKKFDDKKIRVLISAIIAVLTQLFIIYSFYISNEYALIFTVVGIVIIMGVYLINKILIK